MSDPIFTPTNSPPVSTAEGVLPSSGGNAPQVSASSPLPIPSAGTPVQATSAPALGDAGAASAASPITPTTQPPIGSAQQTQLDAHVGDQDNPHGVTAEMLGAATNESLAAEEAARLAGDKYNGTSRGNNGTNASNPPFWYDEQMVSDYFIFGSQAANLGFPAGGRVRADLRYCAGVNYSLAKMTFRSYNGTYDLVRYSANATGAAWTDWEQNLTTRYGAITQPVTFDVNPKIESAIDFSNPESAVNVEMLNRVNSLDNTYDAPHYRRVFVQSLASSTVGYISLNLNTLNIPKPTSNSSYHFDVKVISAPYDSSKQSIKHWWLNLYSRNNGLLYYKAGVHVLQNINVGNSAITVDDIPSGSYLTDFLRIPITNGHTVDTTFTVILDVTKTTH